MFEFIYTLLLFLGSYLIYAFWFKPWKAHKNYVKLFTEKGYRVKQVSFNPFKSSMIATIRKGMQQGDAMKLFKDYGQQKCDVVITNLLYKPRIELLNPGLIGEFFALDKHYDYPKQAKIVGIFERVGGFGLAFSEGKVWKRKRSILNKVFNFDFIKSQSKRISDICKQAMSDIETENNLKNEEVFQIRILELVVRIFANVTLEIFLGGTKDQKIDGVSAGLYFQQLVGDLTQESLKPLNFLLGQWFTRLGFTKSQKCINRRISKYQQWGKEFVSKRICTLQKQFESGTLRQPKDIIEALVIDRLKNKNSGQQTMEKSSEIFEEFTNFMIAGTDTTSNFTQMMVYLIAENPRIDSKVRQQIARFMSKGETDFNFQNMKNFKYIDCVEKEVTRFYGPGTHTFSRVAMCDNYLNGIPIKKGTSVTVFFLPNHYNEKYFDQPLEFNPQRWESENTEKLSPFVFGGFGGGARACIGKHLAMLESKIALIAILERYKRIQLPQNGYKMVFRFAYAPQDFKVRVLKNSNSQKQN